MLTLFANVLTLRATCSQSSARAHIRCEWRPSGRNARREGVERHGAESAVNPAVSTSTVHHNRERHHSSSKEYPRDRKQRSTKLSCSFSASRMRCRSWRPLYKMSDISDRADSSGSGTA